MDILTFSLDQIEIWMLMLFRIGSLMMTMPFYGFANFPVPIRAALAFVLTSLLFPMYPHEYLHLAPGVISFFGLIAHEIIIGLAIGMIGNFVFVGVQLAGQMIGHTMGFGIINVVDPQSESQVPILSQILYIFVLMLFILAGGHHFLLMAIDESFIRIPIGGGQFSAPLVEGFARLSADIFIIGVKVGAPVLIAILVTEFALGVIARTVPQMNVWLVGFPLKIGIGLLTLALALPYIIFVFEKFYAGWQGNFIDFIQTMAG